MAEISFLGGAREVGRSAILLKTGSENILLDYGVRIDKEPPVYPRGVDVKLNAILISHAHLDHMGALPIPYRQKQDCPNIGINIVRPLSKLLLTDSIKIARYERYAERFTEKDMRIALKYFKPIKYRKEFKIGKTRITAFDAGHIPGSAMFLVETQGKKILYTGDFKLSDTRLVKGADIDIPPVDVLITESTYSKSEHPDRQTEERKMIEIIRSTLADNGVAVIACFAISRAQELVLILDEHDINYPVYMDGMAVKATEIMNGYPELQGDFNQVKRALRRLKIDFITHPFQRKKIIKQPCIVITPSGMLSGGPVSYYIKKLHDREECSLILTGFQIPGTEGEILLKTGRYIHENLDLKVSMNVKKFNFSSHASKSELFRLPKIVKPENIFCVHGDNTEVFANDLKSMGFDAFAPSENETFSV